MGLSAVQYYVNNVNKEDLAILQNKIEQVLTDLPLLLIQSPSEDWVGVGVGEDELFSNFINYEKNLQGIYKALNVPVIAAMVHDSDALSLILQTTEGEKGDYVDVGRLPVPHKKSEGNLTLWQTFLKEGVPIDELKDAFDSEPIFVEEALLRILELLGIGDATFFDELLTVLMGEEY